MSSRLLFLPVVHRYIIIQAMNAVNRANYVKDGVDAYFDSPLLRFRTSYEIESFLTIFINRAIGHGATISAPHMVSFLVSHKDPQTVMGS